MNYQEALAWLYSARASGIKLGLETTLRLFAGVGNPHERLRFLHVAGTNGKGSVCAMLDSICRAAGLKTGLYTSPHLVTFAERMKINGVPIPREEITAGLNRLRAITEGWEPAATFFELTTALALDYFAANGVEIVVLETGLGGRLDSTNAVNPLVSVITPIDMDHQQYLGNTIAEIAGEKAGIFKAGVPAVSSPQTETAELVLREKAKQVGTPLRIVTEPLTQWPVNLAGSHQRWHAAVARAAVEASGLGIAEEAAQAGLATVQWPGRFQKLAGGLVVDGAHNPAAAELLARTWREEFGDTRATLVLGILGDKDAAGIIRALAPVASSVIAVAVQSERSLSAERLAALVREHARELPVRESPTLADALRISEHPPVLVAGSLFLVGEVLALQGQIVPDPCV